MDKTSGRHRVSVGRFLVGNVVSSSAFMLTYAVSLLPGAISADLIACTSCTRQERLTIVTSRFEGLGAALFLVPFVFIVMLPMSLALLPLVRLVLARVRRTCLVVALGGLTGATLGTPVLVLIYASDVERMTALMVTVWLPFLLPSTMAGATFAGTLVIATGRRAP